MPLTIAHPGFVLFFKQRFKKFFSLSGLVIGSLTPDLDILFRFTETDKHIFDFTWRCIFFELMPIAILLGSSYLLFKKNKKKSIQSIILFISSSFIAIVIHLFLDAISHINAWLFAYGTCLLLNTQQPFTVLFYFFWYSPQLLFTLAGFWLTYLYLKKENLLPIASEYVEKFFHLNNLIIACTLFLLKLFLLHKKSPISLSNIITDSTAILILYTLILFFIYPIKRIKQ